LVHHHIAYRAFVRAKVACLRFAQGLDDAADEARALAGLSHRHLVDAAVTLVLVGGLTGAGKSTLAGALADRFGMVTLSSDRLRKELAGQAPEQHAPSSYQEGLYSAEWTRRTYGELLRRAEALLGMGESVVLDASWTDRAHRAEARALATRCSADLVELRCQAPVAVTISGLAGRVGPSDADASTAARMAQDASPWPEATTVDTAGPLELSIRAAASALGGRQPPLSPRARS